MKTFRTLALAILATLLVASPVSARGIRADGCSPDVPLFGPGCGRMRTTETGQRLRLDVPQQVFAAGEPFWIGGGFSFLAPTGDRPEYGNFDIVLEVDGQAVKEDYMDRFHSNDSGIIWGWIFNFPEGMTGTHTFTWHWISSCQYASDMDALYGIQVVNGPCAKQTEPVDWVDYDLTSTVVFQ